jgi:hypothetical protein
MRRLLTPVFFVGRVLLWIVFFPVGIWRSLVHHRKKGERRAQEMMRRELDRREAERPTG